MANENVFSWNAAPGAVNYDITITNSATSQSFTQSTTDTFVSLDGLPSGRYAIQVKANFANGSSSIIVEDVVVI